MGIVFYPGAKVEYTAYDPLMRDLAKRGHFVVVVEMPFNFAFFNINAADGIRAAYPQMEYWWVGGHSPGGSMAAQYAANHADDPSLAGLVLLGAYSASDLSASNLEAIIVYGENNRVLDRDKLQKNASLLPPNSLTVEIPGGNHASFSDYGPQEGDGRQLSRRGSSRNRPPVPPSSKLPESRRPRRHRRRGLRKRKPLTPLAARATRAFPLETTAQTVFFRNRPHIAAGLSVISFQRR